VDLVGVVDANGDRAREIAARLDSKRATALEELLDGLGPDGVVVATPAANHARAIKEAAGRGVHVFCEKPLSCDGPAAAEALDVAARAKVMVQVGFQMRFDRDLARLAAVVHAGELGTLYQFRASLRDVAAPSREYLSSSGGYFWDGAIHCFDLARWLLGEVVEVSAFGAALSDPVFAELGDVDNAMVVLRFASGALGVVDLCRTAGYGFESGVEVLGEHGAVRAPGGRIDGLDRYHQGRVSTGHVLDFMERFAAAYAVELDAFAELLRDGASTEPRVSGEDGLAAMRIAEAASRSHRTGRTVQIADIPW
jgi:predicted dehydrogenase